MSREGVSPEVFEDLLSEDDEDDFDLESDPVSASDFLPGEASFGLLVTEPEP